MASQDDVDRLVHAISALTRAISGDRNSPFSDNRKSQPGWREKAAKQARNIDSSAGAITRFTQTMHGGSDQIGNALKLFATYSKWFIGGQAVAMVFEQATTLAKTYNNLANVGQTFGGSITEMAKQAAQSELSLEQFAKVLERNSSAAVMFANYNKSIPGAAKSIGEFSKNTRDSLWSLGVFSMNMDDVAGAMSDYIETLRITNQLDKSSTQQQQQAGAMMIKNATELSGVTGKSRDAILKGINEAFRETRTAARIAAGELTEQQQASFRQTSAFYSAIPGQAGEAFNNYFAQMVGAKGNAWNTDLGKSLNSAGLHQVNSLMREEYDNVMAGRSYSKEEMAARVEQYRQIFLQEQSRLNSLSMLNTEAGQAAKQALAFLTPFASMDQATFLKNFDAQAAANKMTVGMQLISGTLDKVSGKFREGYYNRIQEMLGDKPDKNLSEKEQEAAAEKRKDVMKQIDATFTQVGETFGSLVGSAFKPETILRLGKSLNTLMQWMEAKGPVFAAAAERIGNMIETVLPVALEMLEWAGWAIARVFNGIAAAGEHVFKIFKFFGLSDGAAGLATLVTGVWMKHLLSVKAKLAFALSNLKVTLKPQPGFPFPGATPGSPWMPGGPGGSTNPNAPTRQPNWFQRKMGPLVPGLRSIIPMLTGMAIDMVLTNMEDFKGRATLMAINTGATMGAQIGSIFGTRGMLIGAVLGGSLGALSENWDAFCIAAEKEFNGYYDLLKRTGKRLFDSTSKYADPDAPAIPGFGAPPPAGGQNQNPSTAPATPPQNPNRRSSLSEEERFSAIREGIGRMNDRMANDESNRIQVSDASDKKLEQLLEQLVQVQVRALQQSEQPNTKPHANAA